MPQFTESIVEEAALAWLEALGYAVLHGPDIAVGMPGAEYRRADGSIGGSQAQVIDFDGHDNNDWLAVNQFTVAEGQHTRRPDVVLFLNGLPLAVIELKNPADENATVWSAHRQ